MGDQRLHPRAGDADPRRRRARRSLRSQAGLPRRPRRLHRLLGAVRARPHRPRAHRRAGAPGCRGRAHGGAHPLDPRRRFSARAPHERDRHLGGRGGSRVRDGTHPGRHPAARLRLVVDLLGERADRRRRPRARDGGVRSRAIRRARARSVGALSGERAVPAHWQSSQPRVGPARQRRRSRPCSSWRFVAWERGRPVPARAAPRAAPRRQHVFFLVYLADRHFHVTLYPEPEGLVCAAQACGFRSTRRFSRCR